MNETVRTHRAAVAHDVRRAAGTLLAFVEGRVLKGWQRARAAAPVVAERIGTAAYATAMGALRRPLAALFRLASRIDGEPVPADPVTAARDAAKGASRG